jgi:hypothetical protein
MGRDLAGWLTYIAGARKGCFQLSIAWCQCVSVRVAVWAQMYMYVESVAALLMLCVQSSLYNLKLHSRTRC